MDNPYDVYTRSKQYREDRLAEARTRHLKGRARENRKARSAWSHLGQGLAGALTLLGAAEHPGAGRAKPW